MKIRESELKAMIREALKTQLQESEITTPSKAINESGDFMTRRELLNQARDAAFDFEKKILKTLNLQNPNLMPPEKRAAFLEIVRKLEKGFVKAVAHAIVDVVHARIPNETSEEAPKKVDGDHPQTGAIVAPTPHNRPMPGTGEKV